jgi:hypothetical protein
MCDGAQFVWMYFHPRIDGEIAPDNAVEPQQSGLIVAPLFGFRDPC